MYAIALLTLGFTVFFALLFGIGKREEVATNWAKYHTNPIYMMTAFLYKPADDTRSRFEFMQDNFSSVLNSIVADTFKTILAPILDIFQITGGGIVGSMGGVHAMQNIMRTMMSSFDRIFSIFDNRYKATMHRFVMTFQRIQISLSRIWGVAINSVYQSMATVSAILSTLDLVMKIVIIILTILVAIILFLFLFLWPLIPVILGVVGVLLTAGMGSAVGGMASTFCFDAATKVELADGSTKDICDVRLGDVLTTGKVTGCLEFLQDCADLYDLHGIRVTGSHIVWVDGKPIHVANHPSARPFVTQTAMRLYCLNTESQQIPVISPTGIRHVFSDWEELGDREQMMWNRHVWQRLNPGTIWHESHAVTGEEAAFHPATLVQGPKQTWMEIAQIRPGAIVLDERGAPTRVLGVVKVAEADSTAVWRRLSGRDCWKQGGPRSMHKGPWYSLITEAGTFRLISGDSVRDFTDVGIQHIGETYDWVLKALEAKTDM